MEKMTTLNLQVDTATKEQTEEIFSKLGLSMSAAVNLFLNQVLLRKGIPFDVTMPIAPPSVNADLMTKEEFLAEIKEGLKDAEEGRYQDVAEFRREFLESRGFL